MSDLPLHSHEAGRLPAPGDNVAIAVRRIDYPMGSSLFACRKSSFVGRLRNLITLSL